MFFSSFAGGRIFRSEPGAAEAKEFIRQGSNGLASALGVLADAKSDTLYVCSDDTRAFGITVPGADGKTALKLYDLKTGAPKASLLLPASTIAGQTPLCNDIVVADDGTAYLTDFCPAISCGGSRALLNLRSGRMMRVGTSKAHNSTASPLSAAICTPTCSRATGSIVSP